jgi:thiol-disulfide isomerase/thioredoxin/DNA-binding protein
MKKIFLLLLIISLTIYISTGCAPTVTPPPSEGEGEGEGEPTGDRVVLVELFNAEGCAASAVINPIMEDLAQQYGTNQVILLEEAGWGKYTTSEVQERFDWYVPGTKHTPFIAFNGLSETFSEGVVGGGGGGGAPTPTNHAPTITSTPITTATVGVEYTYDVEATDPDGDTLYYYLVVSPTGMTIDENTGLISWTPAAAHIGDNAVVVEVSDLELSVTQGFTIVIPGSLCGTVTSDASGPAVEGSLVEVKDGANIISTTNTDAQGRFGVAELTEGTYDIIVTQSGRATSKAQDVHIISSQTTVVNLVQKEVNVPSWECESPTIAITGISEGDTISGTIANITVNIVDDSDVKYIFIGNNYIPNQLEYDFAYYDSSNITLPSFDTTLFPDGDYQVTVVAYDMNYNRSQLTLNVTISNVSSGTVPATPTDLWPLSVTLGEKVGYFSTGRNELFNRLGIKENPNIINLPEGRSIGLNAIINVAVPDSNLYVEIDWENVVDVTGYKIYRKFEGETTYRYIGSTQYSLFYDTDSQLSVGRKTYYQVSAFNAFGESEKTPAEWTTPLPKFNLNLVSPGDHATGVSLTPTLQWHPVEVVGEYQHYDWYIMGKNDNYYTGYDTVENETSVVYDGEPLQYLKVYEWNIDLAIAFDDDYGTFPEFRAVSVAGNYDIIWETGGGSLNGAFEFTTQSE